MNPEPAAVPVEAPFALHSIHFNFSGSQAIELRDPATNLPVGIDPEWDIGGRDEIVAYLRGTRPEMQVVFQGTSTANGWHTVGADGILFQVEERQVNLTFDSATGNSAPQVFRASGPLPGRIGIHPAKLDWYIRLQPSPAACPHLGTSTHRICTTWRVMTQNQPQELEKWVYKQFMEWTCEWAAGQDDEKGICDAIIANIHTSGLRYGWPLRVRGVRYLLQQGGGMCGDWYMVFQQMAHCQGVFVYRRSFLVEWRQLPNH